MTSKNDFLHDAIYVRHDVFIRIRNIIFLLISSSGHTKWKFFYSLSSSRLFSFEPITYSSTSYRHPARNTQVYSLHITITVIRQPDTARNLRYHSPVSNVDEELLGLNRSHQVGKACSFNLDTRQHKNKSIRTTDLRSGSRFRSGFGSGSGSSSSCQWLSTCQQKSFLLITFWRYIYIVFKDKSNKEVT